MLLPALAALAAVTLQPVAAGFERPVLVTHAGDGSGRLFVVEQTGKVFVLKGGARLPTPFLDVSKKLGSKRGEQGLLGLAFHPKYRENGLFFVGYTDAAEDDAYARGRVSADPDRADPSAWTVLLAIDDPASNHNGGHVAFGDDGMLWLGTGDGGAANDLFKTAQDPTSLLGKMLRVDVDGKPAPGNAYDGRTGAVRKEVWAIGLRNPWRYSFDRATGDLWIADVGQNTWEEVHVVEKAARRGGMNFGWSRMEGRACFSSKPCSTSGLQQPVFVYGRDDGCSITGGYVYRGAAIPALQGTYLVGDYCSGKIWGVQKSGAAKLLLDTELSISSFGEDEQGEVYVVDHKGGIFKLAP